MRGLPHALTSEVSVPASAAPSSDPTGSGSVAQPLGWRRSSVEGEGVDPQSSALVLPMVIVWFAPECTPDFSRSFNFQRLSFLITSLVP